MKRTSLFIIALLPLLGSCSFTEIAQVAVSRDPSAAIDAMARNRVESYKRNPVRLINDIQQARRQYQKLVAALRGEVGKSWGKREVVTPSNKRYVKYTQNYKSRAIVEFDKGTVVVETLDEDNPQQSLKSAIVTTLLTPDDPRSVDLYSDKSIKLSGTPYLHGLVVDHDGKAIGSPWRAERYADHLLADKTQRRSVENWKGEQPVLYVKLKMVPGYENQQAMHYQLAVEKNAKEFGVSRSLIYAIMKTESAFNPFAVSSAPAYGLMQLVPSTGGRDAYKHVKGYDHTPSKEYLFNSDNNIELGTAYLSILDRNYLAAISDPLSREYCTISAYNGGAGNVFKLFSKERNKAAEKINSLPPAEVYRILHEEHPRDETRRYLVKVLDARKEFATL